MFKGEKVFVDNGQNVSLVVALLRSIRFESAPDKKDKVAAANLPHVYVSSMYPNISCREHKLQGD